MLLGSNTLTRQPTSLFHRGFFWKALLQLRDVYPPGFVATVYSEGLDAVFEFPGEITLPQHVRKGPPLTVLEEEKLFLSNIMSREKAF